VVTVAATGAGLALPLLGTGAAHAADNSTWDKVAACETGGLWSADTGNGFFGGLALTQETWDEYGGGAYAKRPDLASRSQQIAVAEKILADIGPDAWPGCETGTGLLKDTAPPSVDPGSTATPGPAPSTPVPSAPTSAPPSAPGAPATTAPGTPTATPPAATPTTPAPGTIPTAPGTATTPPAGPTTPVGGTADTPGVPGPPATAGTGTAGTPGTPGAAGSPAVPGTSGTPGAPGATAPSATPGGGKHAKPYDPTDEQLAAADQATRTHVYAVTAPDAPDGTAAGSTDANNVNNANNNTNNGTKTGTSSATATDTYTVDNGDSLSGIAAAHHVEGGWQHLYDANHRTIGVNPNLIKPGQILNIG
jgi:LysM repeat protein